MQFDLGEQKGMSYDSVLQSNFPEADFWRVKLNETYEVESRGVVQA
jgi:hypothetical protein